VADHQCPHRQGRSLRFEQRLQFDHRPCFVLGVDQEQGQFVDEKEDSGKAVRLEVAGDAPHPLGHLHGEGAAGDLSRQGDVGGDLAGQELSPVERRFAGLVLLLGRHDQAAVEQGLP